MAQIFKSPANYVQGRGVATEIGDYAEVLGDSAVVIGDETVLSIVESDVVNGLEESAIEVTTEEFNGECSQEEIDRLTDVTTEANADIIVGAGGGKTLDTAKAVKEQLGISMVSMPTIASTDSPTSALSVIYSAEGEFEEYWFHTSHPEVVLVDTSIIAAAPTRMFRSGIADGLATWFEADAAYTSDGENFFEARSTRAAHTLAHLCYETLREHSRSAIEAVENDSVTESVEAVTEANTLLSGLGFESGGIAAAHSVHNGLTQLDETHDATHGEKVNVGTLSQLVLEGRDDEFIEEYIDFSLAIDLPVTLADIGVESPSRDQLDVVAEAACAADETIHNEPFAVQPDMVRDAIRTADGLGQTRKDQSSR